MSDQSGVTAEAPSKDEQREDAKVIKEALKDDATKAAIKDIPSSEDLGPEPADQHRSDHVQLLTGGSGHRPDQLTVADRTVEPFYGHYVTVVGGEHEGVFGVYDDNCTFDKNGKPATIFVRERGADNRRLVVKYEDVRPAESRGSAPR